MLTEKLEQLKIIADNLADGYHRLKEETMRTSAQLQEERLTNQKLRDFYGYTANCVMYDMQDREAYVHFLTGDNNFFFKNIDEVCRQLIATNNYVVPEADVESAKAAAKSFKMSDLGLTIVNYEFSYFVINTKNYVSLNPAQRRFAEAVHGEGDDFKAVMDMLSGAGKITTGIYVLNPEYVQKYLHYTDEKAVARACWLNRFMVNSVFDATYRFVNRDNGLRGVLSVSAEGGASANPAENKAQQEAKVVISPTIEEILQIASPYVSVDNMSAFKAELEARYSKVRNN